MNCVLFAKMDQVFSLGNRTLKKYWKNGKKYWKSQGKVREFCQSGKVGTLNVVLAGTTVLVHLFASSSTQVDRIPLFRITPDREMRPADYQNGKFF